MTKDTVDLQPEHPPCYENTYLVQRFEYEPKFKKSVTARFGNLFRGDCMGAAEFEVGKMAQSLRRLNQNCAFTLMDIGPLSVRVFFNPAFWNTAGVQKMLTDIWNDQRRLKEPSYFNDRDLRRDRMFPINAWADIENDLFWTIAKVDPDHFFRCLSNSVKFMDGPKEQLPPVVQVPQEEEEISPERQRLIDQGVLRPRTVA